MRTTTWKATTTIACCVLAAGFLSRGACADQWDKEVRVAVKQKVEVPGRVLNPGDYIFRVLDSSATRDVVQIFNGAGNHLVETVLAVPDYRPDPPSKVQVELEERHAGQPEAIKALFFPGDYYGEEFLYPRAEAPGSATVSQNPR